MKNQLEKTKKLTKVEMNCFYTIIKKNIWKV